MMKLIHHTVVCVALVSASSCSFRYQSQAEADDACVGWISKDRQFSYERELLGFEKRTRFEKEYPRPTAAYWDNEIKDWEEQKAVYAAEPMTETKSISARYCAGDPESNQFVGYENSAVINGTYKDESDAKGEWKITKIFRH